MSKIDGTVEAWESGNLGCSEEHAAVSDLDFDGLDEALEMKPISIRMQKSMIDDLKMIAMVRGLGYQPLMKQVLARFVEAEKKQLLKEAAYRAEKMEEEEYEESARCA